MATYILMKSPVSPRKVLAKITLTCNLNTAAVYLDILTPKKLIIRIGKRPLYGVNITFCLSPDYVFRHG